MTPILDLRIIVLDAVCRAQRLPDSAERTIALDHLRWAARTLLPLVQAEEDDAMRAHLRDRDTLPAPAPDPWEERWHSRPMPQDYEPIVRVVLDEREHETMLRPPPPDGTEAFAPGSDVANWSMSHE